MLSHGNALPFGPFTLAVTVGGAGLSSSFKEQQGQRPPHCPKVVETLPLAVWLGGPSPGGDADGCLGAWGFAEFPSPSLPGASLTLCYQRP